MRSFITLAIAFLFLSSSAFPQGRPMLDATGRPLAEFHVALMKQGPKALTSPIPKEIQLAHMANIKSLLESGKAIIAGPLADKGELVGIVVLRAGSGAEAKAWIEADPAVSARYMVAEMHPWLCADIMKRPAGPLKLITVYLRFFSRGATWTAEQTAATEELQSAHLMNIRRLMETKKLSVAGPFADDTDLRGMSVFKVASYGEAIELSKTDPAVKAGRLSFEIHPWLVPDGILP
jgi:uncharacterized protein YciI